MTQVDVNLGVGSSPGKFKEVSGVRHVNCYVHAIEQGKYPHAIFPIPGLTRWDSGTITGGVRSLVKLDEFTLVGVFGNRIIEFAVGGTATDKASIIGSGRLYAAVNMKSTPQVCFVTQDKQAYIYEAGTLTKITDSDLKIPTSVTWLDGYFIFSHDDGTFTLSSINEGSTINAADNATAESKPDTVVRVFAHGGLLYVFGSESLEIWQNTGNSVFPFEPVQSDIDIGCMAGHTVKEFANGLAFVDHNGVVRLMRGGQPSRASNDTIESKISALSGNDKAAIEADVVWHEGNEIYVLQSPGNWTYGLNAKSQQWFEFQSYGQDDWRATNAVFFNRQYLIGDRTSGKIYLVDPTAHDEDGNHLIMSVYAPIMHNNSQRARMGSLTVDVLRGHGLNSVDTHISDPELMLSYSDDGGETFSNERRRSMGGQAEKKKIIKFNRLGQMKPNGRMIRLSISAPVSRGILSAKAEIY